MEKEKMKLPLEIKKAIDGLLAPYGMTLDQINKPEPEQEQKESLETVYLTVQQAEEYTHFSRWSLGRYAKAGKIKSIKMNKSRAGKVLLEKKSLDDWLAGKSK